MLHYFIYNKFMMQEKTAFGNQIHNIYVRAVNVNSEINLHFD